jgi:hypothetical protein
MRPGSGVAADPVLIPVESVRVRTDHLELAEGEIGAGGTQIVGYEGWQLVTGAAAGVSPSAPSR